MWEALKLPPGLPDPDVDLRYEVQDGAGAHDIRFIRCIPLTSVDNVMCPDIGGSTRGFD
jgi:hypothetical protein